MVNAEIQGDIATLELRVKIPRHYYDFFEYLENAHCFDTDRLTEMAANGIISEGNLIQESLNDAFGMANSDINPELNVGSMRFKKKEERQP